MKLLSFAALLLVPLAGPVLAQTTPAPSAQPTPVNFIIVQGRVLDAANGQGLPGVTVLLKGTAKGVSTNAEGRFTLADVPAQHAVLVISNVAYVTQEQPVRAAQMPDIKLVADSRTLSEVVVTGYATQQRNAVTGSATTVLQGRIAGVQIRGAANNRKVQRVQHDAETAYSPAQVGYLNPYGNYPASPEAGAGDTYANITENKFQEASKNPLSTFALDVDGASYTNVRRFLNEGQLPPRDAVRVEEMLNYFTYHYPAPPATSPDPVRISTELTACPWRAGHQLARIAVQARRVETASLPPANLVFLVDVSGSMMEPDRLPLVQAGLKLLVRQLRPQDRVALVAYAGAAGLVLPSTPGSQPQTITDAIDHLQAGGSTAGGEGLRLAYAVAAQNFQKDGNNRVILCSDGDFNVGESSEAALESLISTKRETGVFLSVLGVGRGNLRDAQMELLADKGNGNGNYAYLDNLDEARRVLVAQFGGTLFTVAKDVKLQVEFNPARVKHYRLVGYENRTLAAEDFNNDRKDAGELGAGHTVTALYEIEPVDAASPMVDKLKYQSVAPQWPATAGAGVSSAELLTVKLRYKTPQGQTSQLLSQPLTGTAVSLEKASTDLRFAAAVAEFGLLLRGSEQRGTATYAQAIQLAETARGDDADGYRAELVRLLKLAQGMSPAGPALGAR